VIPVDLSETPTPTREAYWRSKTCFTGDTNRTRRRSFVGTGNPLADRAHGPLLWSTGDCAHGRGVGEACLIAVTKRRTEGAGMIDLRIKVVITVEVTANTYVISRKIQP
jgi:hypothetical protein